MSISMKKNNLQMRKRKKQLTLVQNLNNWSDTDRVISRTSNKHVKSRVPINACYGCTMWQCFHPTHLPLYLYNINPCFHYFGITTSIKILSKGHYELVNWLIKLSALLIDLFIALLFISIFCFLLLFSFIIFFFSWFEERGGPCK